MMRPWVFLSIIAAIAMIACAPDEPPTSVSSDATREQASPTPCVKGELVNIRGFGKIPTSCPSTEPQPVGFSERVTLGSVIAPLPCKELPDFAGSFWKVVRPYPKRLGMVGHDVLPGKMTLVSQDEAHFTAKAIRMHMSDRADGTMRFPAKGRLSLTFERIEGAVAVGGCD